MKKLLNLMVIMLIMLVSPLLLSACKPDKQDDKKVVDFSVAVQNDIYSFTDNTINVTYSTSPLIFKADDFRVSLIYNDNSKMVIRENNLNQRGFTFSSNVPKNTPASVGEYELTFGYYGFADKIIKVKVNKADYVLGEYEWDYSTAYTYDGGEKIITLKTLPQGVSATYEGNSHTEAGKYKAIAHLKYIDGVNYNPIGSVELDWEIKPKQVDLSNVTWNYTNNLRYTGYEQTITLQNLPNFITALYTGNSQTNAGFYTASAELTYNTNNYVVSNFNVQSVQWQIKKAQVDMSGVTWSSPQSFGYDGNSHSVIVTKLPQGVSVSYENNDKTEVGNYTAVAHFTYTDTTNYEQINDMTLNWSITQG